MTLPVNFAAKYTFVKKSGIALRWHNLWDASAEARRLRNSQEFTALGGQSVAVDYKSGNVTLNTATDGNPSQCVLKDMPLLHWLAQQLGPKASENVAGLSAVAQNTALTEDELNNIPYQ